MAVHFHVPGYCLHKARGIGYVRLGGKVHYLPGPYRSPQSVAEYHRLLGHWQLSAGQVQGPALIPPTAAVVQPAIPVQATSISIAELVAQWLPAMEEIYPQQDGKPNKEIGVVESAMRTLLKLHGVTPAAQFGPKALKAVRDAYVDRGLSRKVVNRFVAYIKRLFGWAVEQELIPGELWHRLQVIKGLRKGRTKARDLERVRPVDDAIVDATLPFLSAEARAVVELLRLTGARTGEIIIMQARDIDMTGPVWKYLPPKHKTENSGHIRQIALGPKAQEIIRPFLTGNPKAFLFSPKEAEARRQAVRTAARKTPLSCGNVAGDPPAENPARPLGEHYTTITLRRAIERATDKAFHLPEALSPIIITPKGRKRKPRRETPAEWQARLGEKGMGQVKAWQRQHHWHPHQLRHNVATNIARSFGEVAAQTTLGHQHLDTTQIYAERDWQLASQIMLKVG